MQSNIISMKKVFLILSFMLLISCESSQNKRSLTNLFFDNQNNTYDSYLKNAFIIKEFTFMNEAIVHDHVLEKSEGDTTLQIQLRDLDKAKKVISKNLSISNVELNFIDDFFADDRFELIKKSESKFEVIVNTQNKYYCVYDSIYNVLYVHHYLDSL